MANRYFQQFFYSFTKKLTGLHGQVNLAVAVKATIVNQGVTLTAVNFGTGGNSITYAVTGGATAGAEVVTVSGNAISVQIELGVSTITQVRTAINASLAAAALVLATGTSATTVDVVLAATALSGGVDGVSSDSILGASVARTGVGEYTITLENAYSALMSCNLTLQAATAVDLVPQIKSHDVTSASQTIVFRLLAGATPTEVAAVAVVHVNILLRNSSVSV
jgi:hypothetical protein